MNRRLLAVASTLSLVVAAGCHQSSTGRSPAAAPTTSPAAPAPAPAASPQVIRMGAASSTKYHKVFDAMQRDFERQGQAFEYTLYPDYFALVDAFFAGEVDIAWNTPQAHARSVIRSGGRVLGPIARDVDIQYTAQVLVRKDSGIDDIQDLVGKTFVLGSSESAECRETPRYYLREQGLDIDVQCNVVDLDGLVDGEMNSQSTSNDIIQAVIDGRADAGAVGEKSARSIRADPNHPLKVLWSTPPFTHCIFTVHADYDPALLRKFREVLLSESLGDPIGREVLVNEGNDRTWIDSANERDSDWGFRALLSMIQSQNLPVTTPALPAGAVRLRVGALSSDEQILSFRALRRYFHREGEPGFDFVMFGDERQLEDAFATGAIDVAWHTPLAHARAVRRTNGAARPVLARDTGYFVRFHVVVPRASSVAGVADLAGRSLVLGSEEAAELSILPRQMLPAAGLDMSQVGLVSLHGRRDAEWRWADDERAVAAAVLAGQGDAGIVSTEVAAEIAADPSHPLRIVWSSGPIGGSVLTARPGLSQAQLARFQQLMLAMSPADPTGGDVLDAEGCTAWLGAARDGYRVLFDAMDLEGTPLRSSR